jgi:hypothetical protein
MLLLASSMDTSGVYHVQTMSEEGEWEDLVEMEFDDSQEPE